MIGFQISAEGVEDRRSIMLGKVDVAHGLHGGGSESPSARYCAESIMLLR